MTDKTHIDVRPISPQSKDGDEGDEFKPMSAAEAADWRARNPSMSVWRVIGVQVLVGFLLVVLVALVWRNLATALSAAYGVAVVVLPAAMFARGVMRQREKQASLGVFALWEFAKLLLAIAMLVMAPQWVAGLNWLALIAAMIVTMNVYWVALLVRPRNV